MNRISRLATTVVLSGGLGLAGLGLGAGIANAGGAYQWCPGDEVGGYGGGSILPRTDDQIGTGTSATATTTSTTGRGTYLPLSGTATIPRARIPGRPPICAGPCSFRGRAKRGAPADQYLGQLGGRVGFDAIVGGEQ
jgi:hypothetical protein